MVGDSRCCGDVLIHLACTFYPCFLSLNPSQCWLSMHSIFPDAKFPIHLDAVTIWNVLEDPNSHVGVAHQAAEWCHVHCGDHRVP